MGFLSRRQALGALGGAAAVVAGRTLTGWAQASDPIVAGRPLVRYPQKTDLILLTSRPPQLETPMKWFELRRARGQEDRSEEHTSELQSRFDLVCRLLLEKKKRIERRSRRPNSNYVSKTY